MSYPVTLMPQEGALFEAHAATDQRWPLGTQMLMQDGRKYRYCLNGGATLVPGNVLQSSANTGNHNVQAASITLAGVRSPTVILGNTAAVRNLYANGYLVIDTTPGGGELYVVNDHLAVLASGVLTANLAIGHAIRTALTASSTYSLLRNPYQSVIQNPITTPTGVAVGIAIKALTSGQYGFIQTGGIAQVLVSGTPILSNRVIALTAAAGVAGPAPTAVTGGGTVTTAGDGPEIGRVLLVGATWMTVKLTLDG